MINLLGPDSEQSRRGFTLIELLVVISIIALLVAILLPTLSRARMAAMSTVCASNLRQMGLAITMYADDHGYNYPEVQMEAAWDSRWATAMLPYIAEGHSELPEDSVFTCPLAVPRPNWTGDRRTLTYGFDVQKGTWDGESDRNYYRPGGLRLAESGRNTTSGAGTPYVPPSKSLVIFDNYRSSPDWGGGVNPKNDSWTIQGYRHRNTGMNVLLLDMHVEFANFPTASREYFLGAGYRLTDGAINYARVPNWD